MEESVMHSSIRLWIPTVAFGTLAIMLAGCPPALTVQAGLDLYETAADNSKGGPPQVLIEASIIEIDTGMIGADFFGPGSDPFTGKIELQGAPLGSSMYCDDDIGDTDTIIERKQDADLPNINSSATVPIELLELSLACVVRPTITYNGGSDSEQWDFRIILTPEIQSTGNITMRRTRVDGGLFDSTLDVYPRLIFTRPSDNEMRILDIQDTLQTNRAPWLTNVPNGQVPTGCQTNFVPSLGKIPVIGSLFSRKVEMKGNDLIIFVTPRIIINE